MLLKGHTVSKSTERGAVAVEFALLVPLLVMILLGIMEFGRAYNAQVTLTNAAREGVRSMAINNSQATARTAAKTAATQLNPALVDGNVTFSATDCTVGTQITVTVSYSLSTMTGIAGPFAMTGKGTMLCGG
jgi:Flp pilus assembly protein TadG